MKIANTQIKKLDLGEYAYNELIVRYYCVMEKHYVWKNLERKKQELLIQAAHFMWEIATKRQVTAYNYDINWMIWNDETKKQNINPFDFLFDEFDKEKDADIEQFLNKY